MSNNDDGDELDLDVEMLSQVKAALEKATDCMDEENDDDSEVNSDDSGDTDEDEDEEEKILESYAKALEEIAKDKYNYENYVRLVDTAFQLSDLQKIRESCELFSLVFPLAPEIWLRWLKIELNIATSEAELKRIHHLFKRALSDYFCPNLALEYANFAMRFPQNETIWNEILSTYALHCMKGREMFEAWREYFQTNVPESPEKHQKLIEMYEKELTIPLCDMEETFIEFKASHEKLKDQMPDTDWNRIEQKYHSARDCLKKIYPFEKQLLELDAKSYQERAAVYEKYIDECKDILDTRIVQVLYERMITDCCLNASCWLKYIKFLERHADFAKPIDIEESLVFNQTDWDVVDRALRNCPWSAELYVEKIFIAEKMELPKQECQNIAETAFTATFNQPDGYFTIWMEYLSYLRRNTDLANDKEVECLRANFSLGWDSLEKCGADPNAELLKMWGQLEYIQLNNFVKGKELWTIVMQNYSNAGKSALWVEFAHLELKKGVDAARKAFKKAVSTSNIDDIDAVVSAWKRLEQCHGTLDQLRTCQEYTQKILNTLKYPKFQPRKRHGQQTGTKQPDNKRLKRKHDQNETSKQSHSLPTGGKAQHERPKQARDEASPTKRKKPDGNSKETNEQETVRNTEKDHVTVFFSNLSYEITENEIISAFPELKIKNVNLVITPTGRGRGFGYVELENEQEVAKALGFDRRFLNGRPVYISSMARDKAQRAKFKYTDSVEPTKLFIKGLPADTTKEELETLFGQFGVVKDTRLVYHKSGAFKRIAYVEYADAASSSKAILNLDQYVLRDSTISVAISAPPPKDTAAVPADTRIAFGKNQRANVARGDQKPRLSFIPRSVQQNAMEKEKKSTNGTDASQAPKSNDDFRKMLLKQ